MRLKIWWTYLQGTAFMVVYIRRFYEVLDNADYIFVCKFEDWGLYACMKKVSETVHCWFL